MFKVGDKVKIKKFETVQEYRDNPRNFNPGFNEDMMEIARQDKIRTIEHCNKGLRFYDLKDDERWTWSEFWLEKVSIQLELFE